MGWLYVFFLFWQFVKMADLSQNPQEYNPISVVLTLKDLKKVQFVADGGLKLEGDRPMTAPCKFEPRLLQIGSFF